MVYVTIFSLENVLIKKSETPKPGQQRNTGLEANNDARNNPHTLKRMR